MIRPALIRCGPVVFLLDEETGDIIGFQRKDLTIRLFSLGAHLSAFETGPFPFVSQSVLRGGADAPYDSIAVYDANTLGNALQSGVGQVKTFVDTPNQVIFVITSGGQQVQFTLPQDIGTGSDPTFRDLVLRHLVGQTPNKYPSAVFGTGAGASAVPTSSALQGDNLCFQFDVTPSATPAGAFAVIATFAFQVTHANTPIVEVIPNNRITRGLMGVAASACNVDTINNTGFTFGCGSGANGLVAGNAYSWIFRLHGK